MTRDQLLQKVDKAWREFTGSYEDVPPTRMLVKGVTPCWSVRDVIAHVTWWEEEALRHLPSIAEGIRPPRYSVAYGGIDAFNALMTGQRSSLSLEEVLRDASRTHAELVGYLEHVPQDLIATDTPFRHRLRLDTYGHYPIHANAIRAWRGIADAGC